MSRSPESSRKVIIQLPPAKILLPILALFGYTAFLITGFDTRLDDFQPIPIYIFFSALLILLQLTISENRSLGRVIYIILTSGFAIVYAGAVVFPTRIGAGNFTKSPWTYIILNTLLVIVFIYDAVRRRVAPRKAAVGLAHGAAMPAAVSTSAAVMPGGTAVAQRTTTRVEPAPDFYRTVSTDFAGLAVLFYVAAFLLDFLGSQHLFHTFGLGVRDCAHIPPFTYDCPYAVVDLNHLNSSSQLTTSPPHTELQTIDFALALFATAVCLLFQGIQGMLTLVERQRKPSEMQPSSSGTMRFVEGEDEDIDTKEAVRRFGVFLRGNVESAISKTFQSLRLVLGPLVWLIPAFSIAVVALLLTGYLNDAANNHEAMLPDLFNPLSHSSISGIPQGLAGLALCIVAVAAVVIAVAVVEQKMRLVELTLRIFGGAGLIVSLTLPFFIYSLAALNAFLVIVHPSTPKPFQVGGAGLFSLVACGAFAVYAAIHRQPGSRR
jgi:hypothetical protein